MKAIIIAVDGPAGSGKSSVCKGCAMELGWRYLDTGAMYRALTWAVLEAGIAPENSEAVVALAKKTVIRSGTNPEEPTIEVDGKDVSLEIRGADVTEAVSAVSANPRVRELLVQQQRDEARKALQSGTGIVVEGRDITTVVLPNAQLKVYLTASPEVRALRRAKEEAGAAIASQEAVSETQLALQRRDHLDSTREASPLKQAHDADELDTSELTLAEVIDEVVKRAQAVAK
ncbi:MAG: (d)CMP kinase [Actinobacteria bacterium]|uniref:(d)CMP kinase n=2 Tax=freshwater metagenome TaxID=449393 RepID=A0A6J7S546_9ZZZZ|nr:(d)CMP kinase [Actinomycetota bacterium]MTB27432.1 (d)CMP kinase [Actinomycetota bacterium]